MCPECVIRTAKSCWKPGTGFGVRSIAPIFGNLTGFSEKFFYPVRKGTSVADSTIIEVDELGGTVDAISI
jgi:hypothetical protein